jgi:mono/diheme cytochrome c family protein
MRTKWHCWRRVYAAGGLFTLGGVVLALVMVTTPDSNASIFKSWCCRPACASHGYGDPGYVPDDIQLSGAPGGCWYWLRSPEEEKRIIIGLYNRYCIRCHGVDGRGVWDIPDVPDFTNGAWQASRSDGQLTRAILEGRGAVMPPFRGTMTLEEGWAMARYLRSFIPGTEASRPDFGQAEKPAGAQAPSQPARTP